MTMCAGMPANQSFGTGMGPILLGSVTCNQSHLELLQCVHPLDIGVHECGRENVAGVICPNVSTTTVIDAMTVQSGAIFGAVGGALAVLVVAVAIALIVMVTVVMIVTKRRKPNHQDATGKGTSRCC